MRHPARRWRFRLHRFFYPRSVLDEMSVTQSQDRVLRSALMTNLQLVSTNFANPVSRRSIPSLPSIQKRSQLSGTVNVAACLSLPPRPTPPPDWAGTPPGSSPPVSGGSSPPLGSTAAPPHATAKSSKSWCSSRVPCKVGVRAKSKLAPVLPQRVSLYPNLFATLSKILIGHSFTKEPNYVRR